ncbi:MAG: rhodanese-like domain-containing protein [Planctomycetes bacterium]|nr:rhodanese-like domain-containing protein [Planctomycetota bacterium]
MRTLRKTGVEIVGLLFVACVLGFGINAVRGSLKPFRDYFPPIVVDRPDRPIPGADVESAADIGEEGDATAPHEIEQPFSTVTFDEAADLYEDVRTATGVFLFVDARNDDDYSGGHIPGAIQCDRFQLEAHIAAVVNAAGIAEMVIVYCNGGDCEDSVRVCQDLENSGVEFEKLRLFAGGWEDWTANRMPIEDGFEG